MRSLTDFWTRTLSFFFVAGRFLSAVLPPPFLLCFFAGLMPEMQRVSFLLPQQAQGPRLGLRAGGRRRLKEANLNLSSHCVPANDS